MGKPRKRAAKAPAKGGRPRLSIEQKVVQAMASVGATNVEIAEFLGCDEGTIRKGFSEILTKARANMKTKLRRAQITAALEGNPTMLIWLGKQMLKQSDVQEIRVGQLDALPDEELQLLASGKVPSE